MLPMCLGTLSIWTDPRFTVPALSYDTFFLRPQMLHSIQLVEMR